MREEDHTIDGFRATTLVGLGGLVGWTAAAAYRWLNGGEFSMFPPPPPAQPSLNNSNEALGMSRSTTAPPFPGRGHVLSNHTASKLDYHESIQGNRNQQQHGHQHWNVPEQAKLAEQVKDLVEALKQQSVENREIVKQLSQHRDTQQTNESIRRLREQSSDNNSSSTATSSGATAAAAAASMAVFCKLSEIQTELTSLRRDIKSLPDDNCLEQWEKRLSAALENVKHCLSTLNNPAPEETTKARNNESQSSNAIDATPVRSKTIPWSDQTPLETAEHKKANSSKESGTHAVARALRKLVLKNDLVPLRVGSQLLYLYTINLSSHPNIPRYRKIFTTNESFQKVDNLNGGRDILHAVGFQDKDNSLVWQPANGEEELYLPLLNEVATALGILKCPGHASKEDLLEKALACLSLDDQPAKEAATPSSFAVGKTNEDNNLPAALKTPDPSVLSPPITKKQVVMPTDETDAGGVSFSPPRLDSSTASAADCSFFTTGTDNNSSKDSQTQELDQMADADNMWK